MPPDNNYPFDNLHEYVDKLKKYNYDGTMYDEMDRLIQNVGRTADVGRPSQVTALSNQIKVLNIENARIKSLLQASWEDGYSVSDSDNFHSTNTEYKESEFYKEQVNGK